MKTRPVNLNLFTISFPITAIASIIHRVTGVLLFIGIPFYLYLLQHSLASHESFKQIMSGSHNLFCGLITLVLLSSLAYHSIAGVRHLLMDMHIGESRCGGKLGAWIVLVLSALISVAMGVCILW